MSGNEETKCYQECEHGGYCDWWIECYGDCDYCKSTMWNIIDYCQGHCYNQRLRIGDNPARDNAE